jgi:8-oxo-dGTP pyrophosphatase MutT (NUDIX family)
LAAADGSKLASIENVEFHMFPFVPRLHGAFAPLLRGMTLGVRGACLADDGRVFLVRHSYVAGWYMPGGGVERGESTGEALERELQEEGGIVLAAPPALFGVYWNNKRPRDHILLYVVRDFIRPNPPPYPNREILEAAFFQPSALPLETTPATRRRLAEILDGAPLVATW